MARSFSLMARSARAAFPPSRTAVAVTPASPTAARESPTPVAIFGTAWHTSRAALRCGLPQALAAAGYTVALVDLPGYGAARSMPVNWSVDDLVSDLHVALGAALPAAPVAIAPHAAAVLAQKYLESYPLAGLVALAPLPPSPGACVMGRRPRPRVRARGSAAITAAPSSHPRHSTPHQSSFPCACTDPLSPSCRRHAQAVGPHAARRPAGTRRPGSVPALRRVHARGRGAAAAGAGRV